MDLTQDDLKKLFLYDSETGVFTRLTSTNMWKIGEISGSVRNHKSDGYVRIQINGKKYAAHRLAWLYVFGSFPPNGIDHINRTRTDNRIKNLRLATHAENHQNRSRQHNNTSGYVGVSWHKQAQKWKSYIKVNNKMLHIGLFSDINEAIKARADAKNKLHQFQ